LEIDKAHRPAQYAAFKTFHPTFLYESLWCLVIFAVIVWAERRFRFREGQTFVLYVAMYTFGRFFLELMRSDPATRVFGVRFNAILSAVLCVTATAWFIALARSERDTGHTPEPSDLDAPTP
jgi:prolipoprotein diacylglyceryltransferase